LALGRRRLPVPAEGGAEVKALTCRTTRLTRGFDSARRFTVCEALWAVPERAAISRPRGGGQTGIFERKRT
jgi:hypothetical protein